jgi:hypothetical protein
MIPRKTILKFGPIAFLLLVAGFIGLFIAAPFIAIWCVNTLFSTSIAYSFINWVAVVVLLIISKLSITSK